MTLLKNIVLVTVAVVALVGCESESKKAANKINDEAKTADSLAQQGAREYVEAAKAADLDQIEDLNTHQLGLLKAKLVSAKSKLLSSKAHYKKVLDIHADNKDNVKLLGKDSVYQAMNAIDQIVVDINERLAKIEKVSRKKSA